MKRLFATVLALAVLALGSGARLLAHEGHEHKVMGTVTMAAADHVMLKDKDGKGENGCEKGFHDCVLQSYRF